jgi:ferredoxin
MKVKADYDLCEANAMCEALAPEVFEIDDDDNLVMHTDQITADNETHVRQAVAACPKAALLIVDE